MQQIATSTQLEPKHLLKALRAFRKGDFSVRLPLDLTGVDGEIADAFNDVVELNAGLTGEFDRVAKVVGKEGQIGERARLPSATGCWSNCIDSVNSLVGDLVQPTSEVARVIGAVAKGDLSQTMQLDIDGHSGCIPDLGTASPVTSNCERLACHPAAPLQGAWRIHPTT